MYLRRCRSSQMRHQGLLPASRSFPAFVNGRQTMLRILLVDDCAVIRRGIKQILTDELNVEVLAETQNADEALALVQSSCWDVMILDISMPGRNGFEVIKEAAVICPKLPILVLSG